MDASTQFSHEQYKLLREELYPKYIELLEETLEILLAESGSSVDEVFELAKAAGERGQPWPCTEFLAAAEDFHSFLLSCRAPSKSPHDEPGYPHLRLDAGAHDFRTHVRAVALRRTGLDYELRDST